MICVCRMINISQGKNGRGKGGVTERVYLNSSAAHLRDKKFNKHEN